MYTHNAKKCTIIVNGFIVTGFQEDDMVEISRDNAAFENVVDPQGTYTRVKSNDKRGTIKILLEEGSPAHEQFKLFHKLDEETGENPSEISVTFNGTNENFLALDASFEKFADVKMGKGLNGREWTILCPELEIG